MPKSYFPPRTLKEAMIIPRTIYEKNSGKPIFLVTLAEEMELTIGSDKFRELITSSAQYGLTTGSWAAEKIELQQTGEQITQGDANLAIDALFSVDLFQKFYAHFGTSGSKAVPSEKAAKDFLVSECKVPERQVASVFENIIQNARDWHLIQDIAGGEKFVPVELAKSKMVGSNGLSLSAVLTTQEGEVQKTNTVTNVQKVKPSVDITPTIQLNIEIHIAPDTPEATIETIFKNMRKYILTNE